MRLAIRPGHRVTLWVCGAILAGGDAVASALSPWRKGTTSASTSGSGSDGSDRARPCNMDVTLCFAPLLRSLQLPGGVPAGWPPFHGAGSGHRPHQDQTTAIVISVLYRGCAIPVAWSMPPSALLDGSHRGLLKELAPAVPRPFCDRGSSPKLWKQICAPLYALKSMVGAGCPALRLMTAWIGRGTAFGPPAQRRCTLLVVW